MQGTTQNYTLDMADGTAPKPLIVKQGDTNSRWARISLVAFKEPWTIPFGAQIHINVRKKDMTYANATCTQEDEHTVLAPITEQMTTVPGTQLGELFFLGTDGDIRSQTFPLVVWDAVSDLDLEASSNDFQALKDALWDVKISTDAAAIATQYATEQGNAANMAAQRANDAADSIQVAVDAAAAAKVSETNSKASETAAAQTQQEVTDYVEAQKAAFVGYSKRESDSKYANAITATAEGEGGVTVEDAWTAPVLDMEVAGRSEQVQTTGAQLIDVSRLETISAGGATITNNRDGSFAVSGSGTLTSNFAKSYVLTHDESVRLFPAGVYTMTRSPAYPYFYVQAIRSGINSTSMNSTGSANLTITEEIVTDPTYAIQVGFYGLSGRTIVPGIIKPIVNAGDTALPYEPYTGGAPSPSPDYPQDIISTGTVSTGAQLLDLDRVPDRIDNNVTSYKYIDGGLTCIFSEKNYGVRFKVSLQPNTVYTISASDISTGGYLSISDFLQTDKSGISVLVSKGQNSKTFNSGTATELTFTIYSADVNYLTVTAKSIMLNTGDTALPWEPYTGGKPAPSVEYPQTVEVRATGANLFGGVALVEKLKAEADATVDGTNRTVMFRADRIDKKVIYSSFEPGKEYTVILYGKNTNTEYSGVNLIIEYTDGTNEILTFSKIGDDSYCVYHTVAQKDVANITGRWGSQETILYYDKCGVFEGNISIDKFEPYRSASASITLTELLRGIGDYRDRIMCRDGVWGIERWCQADIFDGSADEAWIMYSQEIRDRYYIIIKNAVHTETSSVLCDKAVGKQSGKGNAYTELNTIWLQSTPEYRRLYLNFAADDVEKLREELQMNPLTVIYPLESPTWEPFDDATQQALNALTTYSGTTHLTITAGGTTPSVTLDYVKDTHKALEQCQEAAREYTDNQIAAIVAALPTATQAAIVDTQTSTLLKEVERL